MRRRPLLVGLAAGLLAAGSVLPVAAVEPIPGRPLPDEPPVTRLTEVAIASLVVDLDDDGSREVVAVTELDEIRGFAAVQAWWVDADGSVTPSNQAEISEGRIDDPAHLFTVRRLGRDVPMASSIGGAPDTTQGCCLTIWEITSSERGEVAVEPLVELHSWAPELIVADLDADGTDELLVIEPDPDPPSAGTGTTALLRWDGSTYRVTRPTILGGMNVPSFLDAGDADGVRGEDVLFVDHAPDGLAARLTRVALRGGALVREDVPVTPTGFYAARILSLQDGPAILTTSDGFVSLMRWRRDATPEETEQSNRFIMPLAVLGSGPETLVLTTTQFASSVTALQVFRPGTEEWTVVGGDLRADVLANGSFSGISTSAPGWTHAGLVPGGFPGTPETFVFSGRRLVPTPGRADEYMVEPMALAAGRTIVGTAGPGSAFTLLSTSPSFLQSQSPRVVAVGASREIGSLDLAATASILEPEAEGGALEPTMRGVASDPDRPNQLIVGREAVEFDIEAPPGSRVWWSGSTDDDAVTVGADGTARIPLLEPAGDEVADGERFARRIWVVTPVGHTYLGSWVIRVSRQPPDLAIDDDVPIVDLAPVIEGQTSPGASLTINGDAAPIADDGTFRVPVTVGIGPTEIRIVVTDSVGNQSERLVTRVWPLDYRRLPWVPIVLAALFVVAGLLYVREPGARPRGGPQDGDSTFEEIGG
jgi:hypothetical protein